MWNVWTTVLDHDRNVALMRRTLEGFGGTERDTEGAKGAGGMIAGLILVGLGSYFLIRTFAPQFDLDRYWPAGLIVLGVLLIALSIRRTPGGTAPGP